MATPKPNPRWSEPALIDFDERLMIVVAFNGWTGCEWSISHREKGSWGKLDSGMASTVEAAAHAAQQALGQVYG